jgi:hypothetical protein
MVLARQPAEQRAPAVGVRARIDQIVELHATARRGNVAPDAVGEDRVQRVHLGGAFVGAKVTRIDVECGGAGGSAGPRRASRQTLNRKAGSRRVGANGDLRSCRKAPTSQPLGVLKSDATVQLAIKQRRQERMRSETAGFQFPESSIHRFGESLRASEPLIFGWVSNLNPPVFALASGLRRALRSAHPLTLHHGPARVLHAARLIGRKCSGSYPAALSLQ